MLADVSRSSSWLWMLLRPLCTTDSFAGLFFFFSRTSSILKFSVALMRLRSPNLNRDYQSTPKQNRIRFDVKLQVKAPPTERPLPHNTPPTWRPLPPWGSAHHEAPPIMTHNGGLITFSDVSENARNDGSVSLVSSVLAAVCLVLVLRWTVPQRSKIKLNGGHVNFSLGWPLL